jgi:hypothetical protein
VTGGLDGLLIRNSRGGPVWPRTFHARIWRQATEAAALPGVRFHDLRHFYASALTAAAESVITVQAALGHASAVVPGAAGEQKRSLWRALAWLSLRALTAGPAPWLHRWHRVSQARVPDDRCAHRRRPGVIEGVWRACPDLLVCSGASGTGHSGRAAGSACRVRRWSMAARSAGVAVGPQPGVHTRLSTAVSGRSGCFRVTHQGFGGVRGHGLCHRGHALDHPGPGYLMGVPRGGSRLRAAKRGALLGP